MNDIWIKICGLTTPDGVAAAVAAGADAIGFVFATSKRQVTAQQALDLARGIDAKVVRVAVMLHPTQRELDTVLDTFKPDVLQTDAEDLVGLQIPAGLPVLPVLRSGVAALTQTLPSRLLFEGPVSGRGEIADWTQAAAVARRAQVVLAGGLDTHNVAAAIAAVRPYGVDVSSGVENAPGVKSPKLIFDFIRAARAGEAAVAERHDES